MKKIIIALLLCLFFIPAAGIASYYIQKGQSILKEDIQFFYLPEGPMMIPFIQMINGTPKIGFVKNASRFIVVISPTFDEADDTKRTMIMPVKKNGKWGAVDLQLKYSMYADQPVIPCVYDLVEQCDDDHVYVTKNGVKTKIPLSHFKKQ